MARRSPQREAVRRAFVEAARPLTAAEVHDAGRRLVGRLGERTVFRHIREMAAAGELVALHYPGQPVRYEPVAKERGEHPHFICRQCHRTFDLEGPVPELVSRPEPPGGFRLEGYEVVFFGLCRECGPGGA